MNVIILDGNENQAVASVRSLGKARYRVAVGATESWSKAGWSKYCSLAFRYPGPEFGASDFVSSIAERVSAIRGGLVVPMTEETTLPLSEHRQRIFEAGGKLVLPAHPVVLQAFDKNYTTNLARSLGIRVPETCSIQHAEEAIHLAETFPLPAVLKPRTSQEAHAGGVKKTGRPVYARTKDQFLAAYRQLNRRASSILVQEFVEGFGAGYFALMHEGKLCAEFAHRRLRDVHPTGSGSALRVSVAPDVRIKDASLKILRALGWHGVAMVEFRVTENGTPVFLEVNGRFWNSLSLAVYAGCDFPALLAEMAETGMPVEGGKYKVGLRTRWLLGDVRHLVEVWRGAPKGFPGRYPSRLETLARFLIPVPGTRHDNFMVADPIPEFGDWLHFIGRRMPNFRKRGVN